MKPRVAIKPSTGIGTYSVGLDTTASLCISWLATNAVNIAAERRTAAALKRQRESALQQERIMNNVAAIAVEAATRRSARFAEPVTKVWIEVSVDRITVGPVLVLDFMKEEHESTDQRLLSITLRMRNLSKGKKLNYTTWAGSTFGGNNAGLSDDRGNKYRMINFGFANTIVGRAKQESVYPGSEITDILVFERPVGIAKTLTLTLEAKNIGGEGSIEFKIPTSRITKR